MPSKQEWFEAYDRGRKQYPGEDLWAYYTSCYGILIEHTPKEKDPKGSLTLGDSNESVPPILA